MRKPFIAGNWKMNTNRASAVALAAGLAEALKDVHNVDVAVCPPFVYLQVAAEALSNSNIAMGAQDVYFEQKGAFTGEISCDMLKDLCCTYAIIGHSERRHVIGETDELINKKVSTFNSSSLLPTTFFSISLSKQVLYIGGGFTHRREIIDLQACAADQQPVNIGSCH